MFRTTIAAVAFVGIVGTATAASAFECPKQFTKAEAAIADATKAMKAMSDKRAMGLVHTLLDDAKMMLVSGRHHHAKPAAGGYDHARAVAKAKSAIGYAESATTLASRSADRSQ